MWFSLQACMWGWESFSPGKSSRWLSLPQPQVAYRGHTCSQNCSLNPMWAEAAPPVNPVVYFPPVLFLYLGISIYCCTAHSHQQPLKYFFHFVGDDITLTWSQEIRKSLRKNNSYIHQCVHIKLNKVTVNVRSAVQSGFCSVYRAKHTLSVFKIKKNYRVSLRLKRLVLL